MMPGELFGETHGKRIVSRVLSFDPVKAEVALRGQRQDVSAHIRRLSDPTVRCTGRIRFDGDPGWRLRSRCGRKDALKDLGLVRPTAGRPL